MDNSKENCQIGMIGLGVMGRNLLLNMASHGFHVAGYDLDQSKVQSLKNDSSEIAATDNIQDFINSLSRPRNIMLLVPAGKPVDAVIAELLPLLQPGDLIIDGGNSHFTDTNRREENLKKNNIFFMGVGISGGEAGARSGPSIMPGGPLEAYRRIEQIFQAVAAVVDHQPCVTYIGPGSAGHYVKMVHNGIEYAMMQLIAESYHLLKSMYGMNDHELHDVYREWNDSELSGYLMSITCDIFTAKDAETRHDLVDMIKPIAEQKGTGMWTSESAMTLQVPTSIINTAVEMRDLSLLTNEIQQAARLYPATKSSITIPKNEFIATLKNAMYCSIFMSYAQGMALLYVASQAYSYDLHLQNIAEIWRGGCIIRSAMLDDISQAYEKNSQLSNLLLDAGIATQLKNRMVDLRQLIASTCLSNIPTPALMASLSYFDAYRDNASPANLIQAQRDYFGSHEYERIDKAGKFHTEWEKVIIK
jgi:6-phosphogluconate dehydrogenase